MTLHEARFCEPLADGRVLCTLCPHRCHLAHGMTGACGVRVNHRGTVYTLAYDRIVASNLDPIEKKPLFHFHPGTTAYSIATTGCSLSCAHCQNWEISQWSLPHRLAWHSPGSPESGELEALAASMPGDPATPQEIVDEARRLGARSIAYTYTEPTVFFELAHDTAVLARAAGLLNVFVTNGYIGETALRRIAPLLDGVNVDLKHFREESYARATKGRLEPVLEAIRLYRALGVWTEITTLVIPGLNDATDELRGIARFVRSLGPEVPWHVTRFEPAYRRMAASPTPLATLHRARAIGLEEGLRYVYVGNVAGDAGQHTYCPGCGGRVLERSSVLLRANHLRNGSCPDCGTILDGVGLGAAAQAAIP